MLTPIQIIVKSDQGKCRNPNSRSGFLNLRQPGPARPRRETEVLRLMAGGCSNREIAESLELSEGVVKNYVSSVLSKLGVGGRTRAVLKGIESGYI
jgi:DNA-binding NarL/FixJ family response regulator